MLTLNGVSRTFEWSVSEDDTCIFLDVVIAAVCCEGGKGDEECMLMSVCVSGCMHGSAL